MQVTISAQKVFIAILILVAVGFAIAYLPGLIKSENPEQCTINGVCEHEQRLNLLIDLIPVLIALGIVIGAGIFYFMIGKVQKAEQKVVQVEEKVVKVEQSAKSAASLVLQFLSKDEKRIIEKLIAEKGKCLQSEISRLEGLGKVKSHRVLRRLEDKHVIVIEGHGKTNIIKFAPEIEAGLLETK